MFDQHRLSIASLKHDPKIVTTRLNNPFRKEWKEKLIKKTFDSFFLLRFSCLSVIKRHLHYHKHDFSALHSIGDFVIFSHFFFKRLFMRLQFYNTSGCLYKLSEIPVLIRAVFKGKIRACQILLNPPATRFTLIYNMSVLCCSYKKIEWQISTKNCTSLFKTSDLNIFEGIGTF